MPLLKILYSNLKHCDTVFCFLWEAAAGTNSSVQNNDQYFEILQLAAKGNDKLDAHSILAIRPSPILWR